jgi:hypothetical protein
MFFYLEVPNPSQLSLTPSPSPLFGRGWGWGVISCPVDYLLNPKNPKEPKLCFVSPLPKMGEGLGVREKI